MNSGEKSPSMKVSLLSRDNRQAELLSPRSDPFSRTPFVELVAQVPLSATVAAIRAEFICAALRH
jgi:hypothetical protein